ncbi:MAG: DUF6273 domain-containing protein [Ruminococcus sp.]|nr:DUF6273 domain-containing protein [Ruminococcus sp.]
MAIAFVIVLNTVIIPSSKYNTAMEYYESGDYENAIAMFEELSDYQDSADMIKQAKFDAATKYYEDGDYITAYIAFEELEDYSDASKKMVEIEEEYPAVIYATAEDGDIVEFGGYNWIVLDKTEDTILIITEDIIEERVYNYAYMEGTTWEECTLREYLNGTFYNSFSKEEQAMIVETHLTNLDNSETGADGGNDTIDKMFLLSINEVNDFMKQDERDTGSCWWLRSPDSNSCYAAVVDSDGSINGYRVYDGYAGAGYDSGYYVDIGVCPACWITF